MWEWVSYRDYEMRNSKNIEKIQNQMKRLLQYYGLDTTEVPEEAYGAPPPPPVPRPVPGHSPGRRVSDGVIGQHQPMAEPMPPRHSLPIGVGMRVGASSGQTGFTGSRGGGFSAAFDHVQVSPLVLQ